MARKKKSQREIQDAIEIGERLRNARTRRTFTFQPMTRKELAEETGIALNSIVNIEKGKVSATVYTIKKLARALRVYTNWILYGTGKKNVD